MNSLILNPCRCVTGFFAASALATCCWRASTAFTAVARGEVAGAGKVRIAGLAADVGILRATPGPPRPAGDGSLDVVGCIGLAAVCVTLALLMGAASNGLATGAAGVA